MNKTVIVSGANSGIGFETAKALAAQGWKVGLICRSLDRGSRALEEIQVSTGSKDLKLFLADLSLEKEIIKVSSEIQAWTQTLEVLVNNAGGYFNSKILTSEGLEYTMALNHLGYFRLTLALWPLLSLTASNTNSEDPVRIVNVSSEAHRMGKIEISELENPKVYKAFPLYGDSKLANIFFTQELARLIKSQNLPIVTNSLHPGFVKTAFGKQSNPSIGSRIFGFLNKHFAIPQAQGAQTSIFLATSAEGALHSGFYWSKSALAKPRANTYNPEIQKALWKWSLETSPGILQHFDIPEFFRGEIQ